MKSRDFYPIDQAAALLKCTSEDLIHKAAWNYDGKAIPIYILCAGFHVSMVHVNSSGIAKEYQADELKLLELSCQCLQEFEAGNKQAEVFIKRKPCNDPTGGYWHYQLRRKNVIYPPKEYLIAAQQAGVNIDSIYPEPIKINECVMVVLAEDLERFQNLAADQPVKIKSERDKLLKQIGLLALVLAEKSNRYKRGKKPNAFQVAKDAQLIIDAVELPGKKGTGKTEICNSISQGLKLLIDD